MSGPKFSRKREIVEQRKLVAILKKLGLIGLLLQTKGVYGKIGYPDVLALGPFKVHVLFEFKKEGEKPTKLQAYRHRRLSKLGHPTHVVYTAKEAMQIFRAAIRAQRLSTRLDRIRLKQAGGGISTKAGSWQDVYSLDDFCITKKTRVN